MDLIPNGRRRFRPRRLAAGLKKFIANSVASLRVIFAANTLMNPGTVRFQGYCYAKRRHNVALDINKEVEATVMHEPRRS